MIAFAAAAGYLIGSLPTAGGLGRLWGVDLRRDGSGNPGANNARRLGGLKLAGLVLLVEGGKGAAAVMTGSAIAGDLGAVAAGIATVAGNVYNAWYRFQGGKGLGISAGVVLTLWPPVLLLCLAVIVVAVLITRSSGAATLATLVALNVFGVGWNLADWGNGWGIDRTQLLIVASLGITALIWRKHWRDLQIKRQPLAQHQEQV